MCHTFASCFVPWVFAFEWSPRPFPMCVLRSSAVCCCALTSVESYSRAKYDCITIYGFFSYLTISTYYEPKAHVLHRGVHGFATNPRIDVYRIILVPWISQSVRARGRWKSVNNSGSPLPVMPSQLQSIETSSLFTSMELDAVWGSCLPLLGSCTSLADVLPPWCHPGVETLFVFPTCASSNVPLIMLD